MKITKYITLDQKRSALRKIRSKRRTPENTYITRLIEEDIERIVMEQLKNTIRRERL